MSLLAKSTSSPALLAASQVLAGKPYVPKRAVQHGMYVPSNEAQLPDMKPGQQALERHLYGEESRDHPETYVSEQNPKGSTYSRAVNALIPHDFTEPAKPMRPVFNTDGGGHQGTAHWRSTYRACHDESSVAGARHHRQTGPSYQAVNPPTCVSGEQVYSKFSEDFGFYGSNPRDRWGMDLKKTQLTMGSTQATQHIPGYQGFLATNTANPNVARATAGSSVRGVDKANLTEQFHTNLVNYAGHKPSNAMNDRGGVAVNNSSVMHRSFKAPPLHAL